MCPAVHVGTLPPFHSNANPLNVMVFVPSTQDESKVRRIIYSFTIPDISLPLVIVKSLDTELHTLNVLGAIVAEVVCITTTTLSAFLVI